MRKIPKVVMLLFVVNAGLGIAYLANFGMGKPFWMVTQLLDLDGETSIAAWYSSMQLFLGFVLGAFYVYRNGSVRDRSSWALGVLPLMLLCLSIDESVQIHEWLGAKSDFLLPGGDRTVTFFQYTGIWMFVLGIPFMVVFCMWAYFIMKHALLKPSVFKKIAWGVTLLLIGALGFEAFSNYYADRTSFFYYLTILFEEIFEMSGGTLIFWGMYDLAASSIIIKEKTGVGIPMRKGTI